jgi:hypothetical protein
MRYKLTGITAADIDDAFPDYGECHALQMTMHGYMA